MANHDLFSRLGEDFENHTRRELNILYAIHGAPSISLGEVLMHKRKEDLLLLAREFGIKYYYKLNKRELSEKLMERYDNETVLNFLMHISADEFDFFETVRLHMPVVVERVSVEMYFLLQYFGLLQSFYFEEKIVFTVPDKIQTICIQLDAVDVLEQKRRETLIHKYAKAATNLYGVLELTEFVDLFNLQNPDDETDDDETTFVLTNMMEREEGDYELWHQYLIDATFAEAGYENVRPYHDMLRSKPRFVPVREQFLRYADWRFYEDTPEIQALRMFLRTLIDDDKAEEAVEEIHCLCYTEADAADVFEALRDMGIDLTDITHVNLFLGYYKAVSDSTRLQYNNGHTAREISAIAKAKRAHPLRRKDDMGKLVPFPGVKLDEHQ